MSFWQKLQNKITRQPVEREARLRLFDQEKVSFFIQDLDRKAQIENISSGGIAIARSSFKKAELEQSISGKLFLSNEYSFNVEARVVHLSEKNIGMSFKQQTQELSHALSQFFRAEMLGARLRLVDKKYLKAPLSGEPLWLTDGHENELYVVFNESGILSFHMSFLGHYLEGSVGKRTLVGQIADPTPDRKQNLQKESELITFNEVARESTLQLAREYVMNAAGIPAEKLEQLLKFI